jgi:drug/metabolite transporter (DMT)-like permease
MQGGWALAVSILIAVAGQLSLKSGAMPGAVSGSVYTSPYVIVGLGLYMLAALLYVQALKTIPLSVAFPTVSISYVAVAVFAHFLWGEPLGVRQLLALGFIVAGIVLLVRA